MPKHEHRKMTIILVIVVIVAIAILGSLLFLSQKEKNTVSTNPPTATVDPRIEELKKYEVTLTEQQKKAAVTEVKKYSVQLTDKEKADRIAELKKYAVPR